MTRRPWRTASLSDPLAVPAPAPRPGVDVELVGGPSDGMLFTMPEPLLTEIVVPLELPAEWWRDDGSRPSSWMDRSIYQLRETWNPLTRRRQYVHV